MDPRMMSLLALSGYLICLVDYGVADQVREKGACTDKPKVQYYKYGITDKDKALILKLHNDARQKVAEGNQKVKDGTLPKACCMRKMVWDKHLEEVAIAYLKKCLLQPGNPDDCNCGQNLYYAHDPNKANVEEAKWRDAIRVFVDQEAVQFEVNNRRPFVNMNMYKHFPKVVWQDSNRIGCATVWFYENGYKSLYACQYTKRGGGDAKKAESMYYAVGEPECKKDCLCSLCAKKMDKAYPNLCNEQVP